MKVQDLFEARGNASYAPTAKRTLVKRSVAGDRLGTQRGHTKDWLEAINARMKTPITADHVAQARTRIKASPQYRRMLDSGFEDRSTARHARNGTFDMQRPGGQRYTILITGRTNTGDSDDRRGGRRTAGELANVFPRIKPADPVGTLVGTMTRAMAHLTSSAVSEGTLLERGFRHVQGENGKWHVGDREGVPFTGYGTFDSEEEARTKARAMNADPVLFTVVLTLNGRHQSDRTMGLDRVLAQKFLTPAERRRIERLAQKESLTLERHGDSGLTKITVTRVS